jgi:hypothetical protein
MRPGREGAFAAMQAGKNMSTLWLTDTIVGIAAVSCCDIVILTLGVRGEFPGYIHLRFTQHCCHGNL